MKPHWKRGLIAADAAPRCGARTRNATACLRAALRNGRCRIHGGLSTGPQTVEGLARSRAANLKHAYYSKAQKQSRRNARLIIRQLRKIIDDN